MTSTPDDQLLSRADLVVLARLTPRRSPTVKEIVGALRELAFPDESDADVEERVDRIIAGLRERRLVHEKKRNLTDDGRRALRAAFDVGRAPSWTQVRNLYFPALALGLRPGSEQATKSMRDTDAIAAALLRAKLGIQGAYTVSAICDVLIAEVLGLSPGPITLERIQAHLLARRAGLESKGKLVELVARIFESGMEPCAVNKTAMVQALGRRWVREAADSSSSWPSSPVQPPVQPVDNELLLALVREAIPRIGAEGRYGLEKVFVSAIWHRIESDRRLVGLSLDRFKRWLVAANRDGWLVLARADLVAAMSPELVAESEIEDRGATFHFVLDHRDGAPEAEWEIDAR